MPKPPTDVTRRRFITRSASAAAASIVAAPLAPLLRTARAEAAGAFRSNWDECPDRVWLGPEYWANPLQDWHVAGGRIECVNAAADRNVHVLTRHLGEHRGRLAMSVRVGRVEAGALPGGKGTAGFRVGIQGSLRDYRHNLIYGAGLDAGIDGNGTIFIGDLRSADAVAPDADAVELRLRAEPVGDDYTVTLAVHDMGGRQLGLLSREHVPAGQLAGNLALACNVRVAAGPPGAERGRANSGREGGASGFAKFWFSDWTISGTKVLTASERAFGPILFSQYTLSVGVLKLTAQMPPLGEADSQVVRLQVRKGSSWATIGEARIDADARTATFRVPDWDDRRNVPYRLAYTLAFKSTRSEKHFWAGTVRRDPADKSVITVADVSCNIHQAFPNAAYVANMATLDPDLLAFTGDQFYESTGGYGVTRTPLDTATIDYLRKWYMHGWTWRALTRDRPSVSLPDDHDVYQGNLWGEGGGGRRTTQEAGGYDMPPEWVNVVYRTQTAHHPDPYDPAPGVRGTIQYYGPLTCGRVSFAILADRQYKSGPEGKVPTTGTPRGDHVKDPDFDPRTADVPGLQLLGATQERFLREWAADWRGADMKAVISQTIFTAMATTHGEERMILRADYDANGWPQTARNRAVREMRKAFAFHLAGDQHLPALVQYGVDVHRDGPVAFAGPAVNVGYPRWWDPAAAPWTKPMDGRSLTGDFTDSFGHPLTVLAVKNGAIQPPRGDVRQLMDDKASGLGVVRFDKVHRTIRIECWPFLADVTVKGTQLPGWPVTIGMLDNYARKPVAYLPTLEVSGAGNPVVQIVDDTSNEVLYTLRIAGRRWRPHVFAPGRYTVKVSEPDTGRETVVRGIAATPDGAGTLAVRL